MRHPIVMMTVGLHLDFTIQLDRSIGNEPEEPTNRKDSVITDPSLTAQKPKLAEMLSELKRMWDGALDKALDVTHRLEREHGPKKVH